MTTCACGARYIMGVGGLVRVDGKYVLLKPKGGGFKCAGCGARITIGG